MTGFKHTGTLTRSAAILAMALCVLLVMPGCFKEKNIAPPTIGGVGNTCVIPMGEAYQNQFYYSLNGNKIISSNSTQAFDLMFDCRADRFNIWLNTAKFMSVIRTNKTDFAAVTPADTATGKWRYELGEFNTDSNAIGQWGDFEFTEPTSNGMVYLVNLGVQTNGSPNGFIKIKLGNFANNAYQVQYQTFGSTDVKTFTVEKDPTRNYRYISFAQDKGLVDNIEPDKEEWDLCFTRYSLIFYEPYYLPYQVTGVLQNPYKVSAYLDSTVTYSNIKLPDFQTSRLQTRADAIGYDWKRYELGDYITKSFYTYFIKTDETHFYKLRFIDFKKDGIKGYPTFEYEQL
jgi:hypothetical protein